jgi:hypothetical protein
MDRFQKGVPFASIGTASAFGPTSLRTGANFRGTVRIRYIHLRGWCSKPGLRGKTRSIFKRDFAHRAPSSWLSCAGLDRSASENATGIGLALWRCCDNTSSQFCAASAVNARLADRSGDQPVSDRLFACQLPQPPRRFGFLSRRPNRRLFVEASSAHLSEHALPLHLPFLGYEAPARCCRLERVPARGCYSYGLSANNIEISRNGRIKNPKCRGSLENDPRQRGQKIRETM